MGSETDDVVDTVQDAAYEADDAVATDEEEPEVVAEESEAEATEAADSAEGDGVDPIAAEVEDVIEGRSK